MTSYEQFRDAIKSTLEKGGGPLTWTEVRTMARVPHKIPHNQWVHQLEQDIKLQRNRDANGIIKWGLG